MLVHHTEPALAAAAVTGVILAARWAATRPHARRQGAGKARPPLPRRTAPPKAPARNDEAVAPPTSAPPAAVRPAPALPAQSAPPTPPAHSGTESGARTDESAVLEAERHVHRCWQRLRAPSDQHDR